MLVQQVAFAQADTIVLKQSSFEQRAHRGGTNRMIKGWADCGRINFVNQTPPDIHPGEGVDPDDKLPGYWGNTKKAYHGETYLGMVTRDDDSWESLSQPLSSYLIGGSCYNFSIWLSKSERYISGSKLLQIDRNVNYSTPVVLRIWGGTGICGEKQLLGETSPVDHTEWKEYNFVFRPASDLRYITIEAFYKTPVFAAYNGHVLVDKLSPITKFDCDAPQIEEVAEATVPPHKRRKVKQPVKKVKEKKAEESLVVNVPAKPEPKKLMGIEREKIREGQTIQINNLYFASDSTNIDENSGFILNEVYEFLAENEDITVEIGGHTNGTPKHWYCDKLSAERAKSVAEYLVTKGINSARLKYKGYGKRKPIANNFTSEGKRKNQRVEIKILKIG